MPVFVDMVVPVKTQVENGISKIFDFRCQTIDVSDQAVFILKDLGLHDEEGEKFNVSDTLTASQRRSGHFCLPLLHAIYTSLIQATITVL